MPDKEREAPASSYSSSGIQLLGVGFPQAPGTLAETRELVNERQGESRRG